MEREDKVLKEKPAKFTTYSAIHEQLKKTGFTLDPNNKEEIIFLRDLYPEPSKKIGGTLSKSAKKITTLAGNKNNTEKSNPCKTTDAQGNLPIHEAAKKGFSKLTLEIVSLEGKLIDHQNSAEKTPLDLAIQHNKIKTAIDIIQLGGHCSLKSFITLFDNKNFSDNNSQIKAKESNNKEDKQPNKEEEEEEKNGKLQKEAINQFLKPLFYTTCSQMLREFQFELVLEVLLAAVSKKISLNFDIPNEEGFLPLHYLARGSHKDFLKSSDKTEAKGKEQFNQLLHIVSNEGQLLTAKTKNGKNVLHFSAQYGELETAEQLLTLASQKNINQLLLATYQEKENLNKFTPLDLAFIYGHKELAEKLYNLNKKALSASILFEMIDNFMRPYSPLRGIEHDKFGTTKSAREAREKRNKAILNCFDYLYEQQQGLFTQLKNNDNLLHFAVSVSENAEDLNPIIQWCENHNLQTLFNQKNHENKTLDDIMMKIYEKPFTAVNASSSVNAAPQQQIQQKSETTETPNSCTLS